jgi:D-beta-D-heptose 7-phosphate kinase/D-beta-D-heptose 1-phosphate adenosyltransferase
MKSIVLITGGFDPIHSGHIAYFKAAKQLGDILIVGINSDNWLTRKKGAPFMPFKERAEIIRNIIGVDFVIDFNDSDGSAKHAIQMVRMSYPQDCIIFANGGDRTASNIPEMDIIDDNLEFVCSVGGEDKKNSSSWILTEWKTPKTKRPWGYYRVLHENGKEVKVKELTVDPGQCLSMQKHEQRAEHWFIVEGTAEIYTINRSSDQELVGIFHKHQSLHIKKSEWHQLCNPANVPLKIVEIQYGEDCKEEDIERK